MRMGRSCLAGAGARKFSALLHVAGRGRWRRDARRLAGRDGLRRDVPWPAPRWLVPKTMSSPVTPPVAARSPAASGVNDAMTTSPSTETGGCCTIMFGRLRSRTSPFRPAWSSAQPFDREGEADRRRRVRVEVRPLGGRPRARRRDDARRGPGEGLADLAGGARGRAAVRIGEARRERELPDELAGRRVDVEVGEHLDLRADGLLHVEEEEVRPRGQHLRAGPGAGEGVREEQPLADGRRGRRVVRRRRSGPARRARRASARRASARAA